MIIPAVFSVLAILGALAAVFFSDTRKVASAAWMAGMSIGALFLFSGAEYLAVIQWIVTTLIAISFLIYATMYGEFGAVDTRSLRQKLIDGIPAFIVGAIFFGTIVLAMKGQSPADVSGVIGPAQPAGLLSVGWALGDRHLIALELSGFMLMAVLVGAGVISRAEDSSSADPQDERKEIL